MLRLARVISLSSNVRLRVRNPIMSAQLVIPFPATLTADPNPIPYATLNLQNLTNIYFSDCRISPDLYASYCRIRLSFSASYCKNARNSYASDYRITQRLSGSDCRVTRGLTTSDFKNSLSFSASDCFN